MVFVSQKQRKAVMAKLRKSGVRGIPIKIEKRGSYFRARMIDPKKFQKGSFRTMDIGKMGHTKLVIGIPKGLRKTRTQSVLIPTRYQELI